MDITGIAMPITKATYLVRDPQSIPDIMREAFAVAATGRPGPVLIDFLKNVTAPDVLIDYEPMERKEHIKHGRLQALTRRIGWDIKTPEPNHEDIRKLADMLKRAEKPLLLCGGGVVRGRAHQEFLALAEKIDAPVAISVMGGGGFPGGHELATGMIGMHGSQASNIACDNCDLLVAVGCRFSDRVALDPETFAAQAKIVQIDIDRAEIDKNVKTAHHIIGDAKRVLEILNEMVEPMEHARWKEFVFSYPKRVAYEDKPGQLTPQQVLETIRQIVPGDSIVATDVGQHQMWTIQHFNFDYPGQLLTSGGFGTMGFGLGAALGAKLGNPDKTVLHITGDGCFRMNGQEMATESHYDIPVITFVFDNRTLGMVRQWQNLIYHKRFSQTDLGFAPDFVKLAEAYGLKGKRVTNVPELQEAIHEALAWGHGYVVDCMIDTDEMVRPMVGGGQPITNFMLI